MHFISARSARLQWRLSAGFFTGRWLSTLIGGSICQRRVYRNTVGKTDTLPTDADALLEEFVELLDTQAQVDKAGMYIYRYLSLGHPREVLLERLGHILLREDAEFHSFQMLEAAFQQAEELDEARAQMTLVAGSRYLAAHAPTARRTPTDSEPCTPLTSRRRFVRGQPR